MKIAVLGASGFVGGHLLRYLRQQGWAVRAIVRRPPRFESGVEYRIADACDVYALRHAFGGCDAVVHAALGTNSEIVDSVAPVYAAAEGESLRRLVYISSGSVHGQSPRLGTNEASGLSVRHGFAYNTAKVRAERRLAQLRRRGSVETVVLRPTIVFGPGSRWVFDFADALQSGTAVVVDGAQGICNSIYVDNLSYAVDLALTRPDIDREVFLVSDAETVRWCDLYRPIAEAFGLDFNRVPSVSPPDPQYSFKQTNIDPLRASPFVRAATRAISPDLKARIRTVMRALRRARRDPAQMSSPSERDASITANAAASGTSHAAAHVTPEMIALQRCRWRLPNDKAVRMLGYAPPIAFEEGCRRSVEWLICRAAKASAS